MKNFSRQQRVIAGSIALLCITALLLSAGYNLLPRAFWRQYINPQTPASLALAPASTLNKPLRIARTGAVESAVSVPVNADYSGQVMEVYIKEGQAVKAGQALLKIMSAPRPAVQQPVNAPAPSPANYDSALKEYERLQKLYDIGAIPRKQLEAAAARLEGEKERSAKGPAVTPTAPVASGPVTLTAPTDGIVSGLSAAAGKPVQAGQQLLSLGSGQEVEIVLAVNQNDLPLVNLGTPVLIEAAQQTIVGQVTRIYPQIAADQTPAFLARVKLNSNPAGLLKSGMTVNVRIDTGQTVTVPAVPTKAIFHDDQQRAFVYVAVDGKAILQQVSTGETLGDYTELTSDLPPQGLVIVDGMNSLKHGDPVTVSP